MGRCIWDKANGSSFGFQTSRPAKRETFVTDLPDLAIPGVVVHKLIRGCHATGDGPTLVDLLHHALYASMP